MPTSAKRPSQRPAATVTSTRRAFTGRVISVDIEDVELPNAQSATLELINHPGGAAVAAVNARGEVCLLHQYRHATGGWIWEVPAGKLDGRSPLETARAELAEEAGRTARSWHALGSIVSSPGVFREVVHLFLAQDLADTPPAPEAEEVFQVAWVPLEEAARRALDGELRDAKSITVLLRAAHCLGLPIGRKLRP